MTGIRLTRRRMIAGGTLAGAALIVGYTATHPMQVAGALLQAGGPDPEPSAFGPFIRIDTDGWVTVVNKQQELGQGIHVAMAAMIAEELDADWEKVRVVAAPGNFRAYGVQMTAGSNAVAGNWDLMRQAGAAARAMFVNAAALRWQVPRNQIALRDGVVSHAASNRSAGFGALLADAAQQTPPREPVLKPASDYRLIGSERVRRKDSLPKSTGQVVYTQDVRIPDMLVAMVAHSPRFGGRLARFDDRDARRIKGVVDVFAIPTGVAVVAENSFAAKQGRDAIRAEWDDSAAEKRSSAELVRYFHGIAQGRSDIDANPFEERGDPEGAFQGPLFETSIDFPYLAHAPLETMDCVARVQGWDVHIRSGSHLVTVDQIQGALAAHTIPGRVQLEVLPAGGSFGRRGIMTSDYLVESVRIAQKLEGRPIKLIWTREDDMAGGFYRPMAHHRAWIALGEDGFPSAWRHHIVSQAMVPFGGNFPNYEGVHGSPYFASASVVDARIYTPDLPVTVGFWRSVGSSHTAMAMEHIVDQLARNSGRDPADYRAALYRRAGATRRLELLRQLCRKADWRAPIETGWARGLAVHEAFGTVVGQVAEVRLDAGRPVVRRVVAMVDCGIAVAPDQIAAQMEGSVAFGLSAALYGAVTLRDGIVQETNFDRYPIVRMNEMPLVETHIMPSTNRPTGMGEPAVAPIAPAVANAMLALTGQPVRQLPFLRGNDAVNAA
ncbi:xanthine dehydrogenase family protein molybdopterin-binding subunit [Sphingomonas sp.]|uniref:xanthine dehydrogenase family protein molybdopterin-binding subunit n=1 Tax=Sphingomonas sp. TaxID=28214 RepID=UPI002BCF4AB4|nr:molybdopterin cofactor-binding domain-containing protein [Sphingomonas sp.]HTG37654.1 molybdopterin cofactor-binding domain-containing protein [Sphingomonas sp.]